MGEETNTPQKKEEMSDPKKLVGVSAGHDGRPDDGSRKTQLKKPSRTVFRGLLPVFFMDDPGFVSKG